MTKKIKREILEWGLFILVIGGLYISGWHTEVLGFIQRGVLATGIIRPDLEQSEVKVMDYNFSIRDFKGQDLKVADLEGEVLFINLWATWCPPCIAEMPDIHDLYLSKGQEVRFLMISLDEDPKKAAEFIKRKGYTFPTYSAPYGLPQVLRSGSIPTTHVVSRDGTITVTRKGLAQYDSEEFRSYLDDLVSQ